jgi:radical SAM superfamily enzyme YgiQ (UPF0313 family)
LADKITGQKHDYDKYPDDLEHQPLPAYQLYNKLDYAVVMTSRGCPFKCDYCVTPLRAPELVQRSPKSVVDEISYYHEQFQIKDIAFYDDALLVNASKHIEPIMDLVIERGLNKNIRFHTPNGLHIKYITAELAVKMRKAGFTTLRLSFDNTQKVSLPALGQALQHLKRASFTNENIRVYVLLGLPGQDLAELVKTIKAINLLGVGVSLSQYAPIPGTVDFKHWVELIKRKGDEPLEHNKSIYPARMANQTFQDYEEIKELAKRLNRQILGLPEAIA